MNGDQCFDLRNWNTACTGHASGMVSRSCRTDLRVEDDAGIRAVLKAPLESQHYRVVEAEKAARGPRSYIKMIRQKLEPDPEQPRYLLTEAGVGYRLRPDDEPPAT